MKRHLLVMIGAAIILSVVPVRGEAVMRAAYRPELRLFALPSTVVGGKSNRVPDDALAGISAGPVAMWTVAGLGPDRAKNGTYTAWIFSTDAQERAGVARLNNTATSGPSLKIVRRVGPDEWIRGESGTWGYYIQGEVSYRNIGFDAHYSSKTPVRGADFQRSQAWVERVLGALVARAHANDPTTGGATRASS